MRLIYDRAGRSNGTAFVVYTHIADARSSIREFDGANAKGQPIRLELLPQTGANVGRNDVRSRRDNPFDRVENPRSLFERVEAPKGRAPRSRSASPEDDRSHVGRTRGGTGRDSAARDRRSDVSKPPPDGIDRYVPGQGGSSRSSSRRGYGGGREGGGRRPGERRERGGGGERSGGMEGRRDHLGGGGSGGGPRKVNGRPRKTQEELDAEMEDYWGNAASTSAATAAISTGINPSTNGTKSAAPTTAAVAAARDEDIDMIE